MKLSELIEEMIQMKIGCPPEYNGWKSIQDMSKQQKRYYKHLEELKNSIDEIVNQHKE